MSRLGRIGTALTLATLPWLAGCPQKNAYVPPPPPAVEVAQPVRKKFQEYLDFIGRIEALERVDLRARVSGYLEKIAFEDGARVRRGDLLFVIDQAPFRAKIEIARAEVRKAETALRLAEIELSRSRGLIQRNAVSAQELEIDAAERDAAAANVAAAQASLRDAELQLSYTEIRSPINGRMGRHLVDAGTLVLPEQTLLATVESLDPIHVYFTMSESDFLDLMSTREEIATTAPGTPKLDLEMGLADEKGFPHRGTLDYTDPGVDPETGTTEYRGVFPNPGLRLVPGLFARVRAPIREPSPRLFVPERAIGTDQRGDYVLVVGPDDTVAYQPVRLGRPEADERAIESGLEGDEWIVVNGIQRARPGAKVDPHKAEPIAAAAPSQTSPAS